MSQLNLRKTATNNEGNLGPTASQSSHRMELVYEDPSRIWDDLPKKYRSKKRGAYIRRHNDLNISSSYQKFKLLLWKNYIVTKRRWKLSLLQFASPIFFVTILAIYVTQNSSRGVPTRKYEPFEVTAIPNGTFADCDTIYLWPNNAIVEDLKVHLETRVHSDGKDLKFAYLKSSKEPTPVTSCAMVEFRVDSWGTGENMTLPHNVSYDIRFPAVYNSNDQKSTRSIGKTWDTAFFQSPILVDGAREAKSSTGEHPGYYQLGFLYIQHVLATQLTEMLMIQEASHYSITRAQVEDEYEKFLNKITVRLHRFPFPGHESDTVIHAIYDHLPTILVAGFGISSIIMVYLSVREKEMGTRTLLKMYGVDNTSNKLAWLLHNWLFLSISGVLSTIILSTKWTTSLSGVYILNEKYLSEMFFLLLFCYIFNIVCFSTLLSFLFHSGSTACISVTLLCTLLYLPYIYIKRFITVLNAWEAGFATVSPHTALAMGLLEIASLQSKSDRNGWGNLFRNRFSLGWICFSLMVMGVLEMLLALYISRVFPEKGIIKLPWNFVFKSWFWNNHLPPDEEAPPEVINEKSYEELHPQYFEDDADTKKRKELAIDNLSKYSGRTVSLHKVSFVCFQDYVTVLLGDEGSGKSTLLNIVGGSMSASSGIIYLSRKDLAKNPSMGRAFIGYCPAGNLLFPDLTVDETLQFFSDIKGVSNRIDAYEEVERFLKLTTLKDCRDTMVCDLTHSSQRMLMVATAFVGGSRVVLLDDPTVNLSATQQRVLWDFIDLEKKHRTVVVAMGSVNEVDSTADKIVLMNNGQVTGKGSPEFLRQKFGGGYHLELDVHTFFDDEEIGDLIMRRISGAFLQRRSRKHFDYYLPQGQSAFFPGLLEELERYKLSYGISKIKIISITLEELYLRLKRMQFAADDKSMPAENDSISSKTDSIKKGAKGGKRATGINLLLPAPELDSNSDPDAAKRREFYIMFLKNVRFTYRNRVVGILSTVVPLLMLMMIHLITLRLELPPEPEGRSLRLKDYQEPHIITDMAEGTNEGEFLRATVNNFFKGRYKQNDLTYEQNIIQEILKEHATAVSEEKISNIGLEIFQSRETIGETTILEFGNRSTTEVKVGVTGYFNNQPLHTPAASLAMIHNILLYHVQTYYKRKLIKNFTVRDTFNLDVSNHPLRYQPADIVKYAELLTGPGYLFGVFAAFAYSFHFPFYIVMHVKEQDFRHLQMIFGANKIIFWGANYLWNLAHFTAVAVLHLLFLGLFGIPGFQHESWNVPHLLFIMFIFLEVYGTACIFVIGSFTMLNFDSIGKGFSKLSMFFILTGPIAMLAIIPVGGSPIAFALLHNLFLLLPSYAFGTGMFYILANEALATECKNFHKYKPEECDPDFFTHPFNEFSIESVVATCCFNKRGAFSFVAYGIGRNTFALILVIVAAVLVKIFSHSKKMREWQKKKLDKKAQNWHPMKLEEHEIKNYDVLAETAKVYRRASRDNDHELTIRNLTLETRSCTKLDNICFEIQNGECFSLLGTTRAGKTTFLKALSGYPGVMPTYGDVEFHGMSLLKNYDQYVSHLSYCPDQNPFLDHLTGRETLEIIGTLRKLSPQNIKAYIDSAAESFDISVHIKKPIKQCNALITKKLCAAAALMGNFQVLLLDDPTSHLDGRSKQVILANVKRLMGQGCIVIWASDGIEHCESICTKMSIMVNGHLRCFGSLDHLRDLYETGFTIVARFLLDGDLVYFTNKKDVWMENEMRENEIDEETGLPFLESRYEERKRNLMEILKEDADVEKALDELTSWEQDLCPFIAFFERAFPNAILVDKQPGFAHYHVLEGKNVSWYELFTKMEEAKTVADVDNYYVCCTSLEQVYFNFTRGQNTIDVE